ncbi:MAG: hypothetical protein GYA55_12175, partial [SAR324 cluster bacterium]|nr:hypothetical protein [SAR324 cluster bacterium]
MSLCLGLDLGTTKIAAALVDVSTRNMLAATSCLSMAELNLGNGKSEQNVERILNWVDKCVVEIPVDLRKQVAAIGITGQMHGVLLWNPGDPKTSSLITWQDQRCNFSGFIGELQEVTGDHSIKSGYACASLAWLAKHNPTLLGDYSCCSTIQDYLLSLLCELSYSVTDYSDAASWG